MQQRFGMILLVAGALVLASACDAGSPVATAVPPLATAASNAATAVATMVPAAATNAATTAQTMLPAAATMAAQAAATAATGAGTAVTDAATAISGAGDQLSAQAMIAAARAEIKLAAEQYKAGQKDAAYETAANAYLNRFENLEDDLEKVDAAAVPAIEADFKALRDGIKAGQAQADIDTIVTRLDAALAKAAGQLMGQPAATTAPAAGGKMSPQVLITEARTEIKQAAEQYKAGQKDAAYETAANAYLNRFENLEGSLNQVDKDAVPAIEADFKALRDGIKAGQPQADIDTIVTRLDAALAKAGELLK